MREVKLVCGLCGIELALVYLIQHLVDDPDFNNWDIHFLEECPKCSHKGRVSLQHLVENAMKEADDGPDDCSHPEVP